MKSTMQDAQLSVARLLRYGSRVLYRVAAVEQYLLSLEQEPLTPQTPLRRVIRRKSGAL